MRCAASSLRMERELRQRLRTLSRGQLELLATAGNDARVCLAWLAAVKRFSFLFEFAAETLRGKVETHDPVLRESDYRRFIEEKTPAHPELQELTESTAGKVRHVLFAMLRETGMLSADQEIGRLLRPLVPHAVEQSIREENPAWLAAFLVPDHEIQSKRPRP